MLNQQGGFPRSLVRHLFNRKARMNGSSVFPELVCRVHGRGDFETNLGSSELDELEHHVGLGPEGFDV